MKIGYGKTSGCAIAAMSALAERYPKGERASAEVIARNRNYSRPLVAKVLNVLSSAGLVKGSRGPGGGFSLARPPEQISIHDIVSLFEGGAPSTECPFGPGYCGRQDPCPLHHALLALRDKQVAELKSWHLGVFREHPKKVKSRRRR